MVAELRCGAVEPFNTCANAGALHDRSTIPITGKIALAARVEFFMVPPLMEME
jgi:hypothetical protein